jgi:hypothetical protein
LILREDRIAFGMREIVCDPLDYLMAVTPKIVGAHIAEGRWL